MSGSDRPSSFSSFHTPLRRSFAAVVLLVSSLVAISSVSSVAAVASPFRVDLRVLLLDDNSPWVDAIQSQMDVEGVPYTAVPLGSQTRQVISDASLSSGDEAFYQAVVGPDYLLTGLSPAEVTALRAFEAKFGVREVDAYNWANPAVGLNYAAMSGDINGTVAAVTTAGRADGFGYLSGPVPFGPGSWSYIAEPLAAASLPAGASYTTLVGAPLSNGVTGSLIGVYSNANVEQLVITAAFSFSLPQFKYVAHGIVSWATRGVHFGYNRNNFTFHVDDAFSSDSVWDPAVNCTPGEDCTIGTERAARMTPDDVTQAVAWMQANNYQLTFAWNGFYADATNDALTQSLQANASAFRWLNHGFEHLYQGCVQDFSVTPWRCTTDAGGNIVWTSQQVIYNEIEQNIATGQVLGLTFDPTEYLSGEHSGLFFLPQQPLDNPNFIAALSQAGILHIGSDASRDNVARQVGSATTIPRHPTALYYNTSTQAEAVDEYNWLYNTRANGGSGYCEDNPATATCLPAPLGADGFTSYIVPTDANFDLNFILSNDPRPFYSHTSNLTDDRLAYDLLDAILGKYRTVFTADAPLVNLTLTDAATQLDRQTRWAATGASSVTGYVQNGQITISNPAGVAVPFTAPTGTTVSGTVLQPYGGEVSGWLAPGSTTGTLPGAVAPVITVTGSTAFVVGTSNTLNIAATGIPTPTVSLAGSLPDGLTFAATPGAATIAGTAALGTGGSYPVTITAVGGALSTTQQLVIAVTQGPQFTSAAALSTAVSTPFSFSITTTGSPAPTITRSGALPTGVTFVAGANGTGTLAGTPSNAMAGSTFPMTFTATNSAGAVTQAFTLTVTAQRPQFTSAVSATAVVGRAFSFTVTTTGIPAATITRTGTLPTGVTVTAGANGTARLSGTPTTDMAGRSFPITFTATNVAGATTQAFTLTVGRAPSITSGTFAFTSVNRSYSYTVQTTASPTATITMGTVPPGLTFVDNNNGTARLSGVPSGRGTYAVTFTAKNVYGTATRTLTLMVF